MIIIFTDVNSSFLSISINCISFEIRMQHRCAGVQYEPKLFAEGPEMKFFDCIEQMTRMLCTAFHDMVLETRRMYRFKILQVVVNGTLNKSNNKVLHFILRTKKYICYLFLVSGQYLQLPVITRNDNDKKISNSM